MNINNRQTLVIGFDEKLISRLNGENIIVTTNNFNALNRIKNVVNESNKLNNITVFYDGVLTSIRFLEDWKNIPLTIYVSSLGSYRMLFHMMSALRDMSIKIFLPASNKQSYIDVQTLSSLGILAGIYFNNKNVSWDKFKDLEVYALYAKTNHAPIEPFQYVFANFKGQVRLDFGGLYYNDPNKYLHVNGDGKVALTMHDLINNNFALDSLNDVNQLKDNEEYIKLTTAWQQHFLNKTVCSFCPTWRICLGKFIETVDANKECESFFIELLEGVENIEKQQKKKNQK